MLFYSWFLLIFFSKTLSQIFTKFLFYFFFGLFLLPNCFYFIVTFGNLIVFYTISDIFVYFHNFALRYILASLLQFCIVYKLKFLLLLCFLYTISNPSSMVLSIKTLKIFLLIFSIELLLQRIGLRYLIYIYIFLIYFGHVLVYLFPTQIYPYSL